MLSVILHNLVVGPVAHYISAVSERTGGYGSSEG